MSRSNAEPEGAMADWALLRQVVLATDDIESAGTLIRDRLGLGKGFADPELATVGLADDTMALAGGSYLELVAPLNGAPMGAALSRWLAKTGGGGYALSVQHPDAVGARDRARALGVRIAADQLVMGHPIVQLHPADAGLLLELDGIADPEAWFWDGMGVDPSPHALVDDVVAVEAGVADPGATTSLWTEILGFGPVERHTFDLGGRLVHLVDRADRPTWTITLRRSDRGAALADGDLLGAEFRYV
jgi:hypothetical protein